MRKYMQKALLACVYLLLVAFFSGFPIAALFDGKEILLVIAGCILLTFPYRKEGKTKRELLEAAGNNSILASYMMAFVLVLGRVERLEPAEGMLIETILMEILISFRPLLYGFIMKVFLSSPEREGAAEGMFKQSEEKEDSSQNSFSSGAEGKEGLELSARRMGLTARETEIVKLAVLGLSNREIAEQLYIAESTVKKHLSNAFEKLQVGNREQLKQLFK